MLAPLFLFILQHLHFWDRENTRTQMKIVESKINIKKKKKKRRNASTYFFFFYPLVKLLRASKEGTSASGNELFCVFSSVSLSLCLLSKNIFIFVCVCSAE